MANIRVDVGYTIKNGTEIKFRSPVDCSAITGLIVYYPSSDGNITSKVFTLADAHGNNVGVIDHLFAENVVVKVILDVTTSMAFVQNADTNAYLESMFAGDQKPKFTTASTLATLSSGEKLSTAFGKIAKAITDLISHIGNKKNPHGVTAAQAGALPISGGEITGTLSATWFRMRANTILETTASQGVCVKHDGWIYTRTLAQFLGDLGLTDYIIANGTSGVWSYWKFNSGLCIAMGSPSVSWGTMSSLTTGQYRSTASLDLTGIFTAIMGGTCSNVHRYVNNFVIPSGSTSVELWATSAANATSNVSGFATSPKVVLFGKWK